MLLPALSFALQSFVIAYLIFADPLYGRFAYQRLLVQAGSDPRARLRFYWGIITVEWFMTGLTALSLWLDHQPPEILGLHPVPPQYTGPLLGVGIGMVAGSIVVRLLIRFVPQNRQNSTRQHAALSPMLPTRGREYLLYIIMAITAGVCEEILFRGLMLAYLGTWVPSLPTWGLVAISSIIFGLAHLYQGVKGVVVTGLLGAGFCGLYLLTGSLWPSIALHALIDLNAPLTAWSMRKIQTQPQTKAS